MHWCSHYYPLRLEQYVTSNRHLTRLVAYIIYIYIFHNPKHFFFDISISPQTNKAYWWSSGSFAKRWSGSHLSAARTNQRARRGLGLNMRALIGAGDWLPGARALRSYDSLLFSLWIIKPGSPCVPILLRDELHGGGLLWFWSRVSMLTAAVYQDVVVIDVLVVCVCETESMQLVECVSPQPVCRARRCSSLVPTLALGRRRQWTWQWEVTFGRKNELITL